MHTQEMMSNTMLNGNGVTTVLDGTNGWPSGVSTAVSPPLPVESTRYPSPPALAEASASTANTFGTEAGGRSGVMHVAQVDTRDVNGSYRSPLIPSTSASASAARWAASRIPVGGSSALTPSLSMAEWRGGGTGDTTDEVKTPLSRAAATPTTNTRDHPHHSSLDIDPTAVPVLKYTIPILVTRSGKVVEERLDPFELGRLYGQKMAALRKLQSRYDFLAVPPWVRLHPELGAYLSEILGTFAWVLTMALVSVRNGSIFSVSNDTNMTPLGIGFMLTSMIFTFGYISNAHLNPAVSIAVFLVRQMSLAQCCAYILCQLAASLAAGIVAMVIQGSASVYVPSVSTSYVSSGIFSELIFTFAICVVVLNVTYSRQSGSFFYGFAAGMTMAAGSASVGHISGGAFNPAAATGLQVSVCLAGNCEDLKTVWIYWLAPVAGAVLAAVLFSQMTQPTDTQVLEDKKVFQDISLLHRQRMGAQVKANSAATSTNVASNNAADNSDAMSSEPSASSSRETRSPSSSFSDPRRESQMRELRSTREERDTLDVVVPTEDESREFDSWQRRKPSEPHRAVRVIAPAEK